MLQLLTTVASHCVERQDNDVSLLILRGTRGSAWALSLLLSV